MSEVLPDNYGYALESNFSMQALLRSEEIQIVVNGHSHRRMVRNIDGRLLIINAGTLFRDHDPCVSTVDLNAGEVMFYDFEGEELVPQDGIAL